MAAFLLVLLLTQAQDDLASQLRELESKVQPEPPPRMLSQDASARLKEANRRESEAWGKISTKEEWERYKAPRIQALRESLGAPIDVPKDLHVQVTKTLEGRGHRVENLVYESRPGLLVSANLYIPEPARQSMPGIVIVHSHHNPKTQSELQEMGVMWARAGCYVLIPDQIGHGERRQHPFVDASSFPKPYRVGRQDYFFRYVTGLQLHLAGESLIGWMAWDLSRGVDLLLARPGIDPKRIILLGSVAGGGDPAAVTAALDPRITAVAPFNFGGPQPETKYPLPDDAETWFNYAGGGSWESTRNLRLSCRDGFLPWVIVGSIAPRALIYGHEFAWDRERDPVWRRFERIYSVYGADALFAATGKGNLKGQPPEASHCNNIGPEQRRGIHSALLKAFQIPEWEKEAAEKRSSADLACFTAKPKLVHELLRERTWTPKPERWDALLGGTTPAAKARDSGYYGFTLGGGSVEYSLLGVDAGVSVPVILLTPKYVEGVRLPVVIAVSQGGKQEFLRERATEISELFKAGIAVCLPDVRGTGQTRPGTSRGRGSESTDLASTEQMNGRTLLGLRVRDLRSLLQWVRTRKRLDQSRIALWGDSFAPVNAPDRKVDIPLEVDDQPALAEPMGGLVAMFGGYFDPDVRAVYVRRSITGFKTVLDSPFIALPYDVIVPGALTTGDLPDVARAMKPEVRVEMLVDGLNRAVPGEVVKELYGDRTGPGEGPVPWLKEMLR